MDYQEYIRSDRWKETRQWILIFWNYRCALCNSRERVEVHHRTYERLGQELTTDCIALCNRCHKLHTNFTGHFMKGVLAGI
jgi:5-methylcytosine-specific restriction endonuclease McrA